MTEYLTLKELTALLRIGERKAYELASSGDLPCSRATGKLLFPRAGVEAWIAASQSGGVVASTLPKVFLGSHDPLLDWALRESGCGLATYLDGSGDGLARFAKREGVATGLHLFDGEDWNVSAARAQCGAIPCVLIEWAKRRRGLIHAPDAKVGGLADLKGRTLAPRPEGTGAQVLFEHLMSEVDAALPDLLPPVRTETEAAVAVLEGRADAAFGLEALAVQYRLGFTPIIEERFDLLVDRRAYFEPPLQTFFGFCRSQPFRDHLSRMTGYAVDALGAVRWIGG